MMKASTIAYGVALIVAVSLSSALPSGKEPWFPKTVYLVLCGIGVPAWLAFGLLPEMAMQNGVGWSGHVKITCSAYSRCWWS